MATKTRMTLEEYLALDYPFRVDADPDGGYVIMFPDLLGCMTQAESINDVAKAADEARRLWIAIEYDEGDDIPLPSFPEEYSGKFNLRLPKSLHRRLAEAAVREGVSLNQLVVSMLADGATGSRGAIEDPSMDRNRVKRGRDRGRAVRASSIR